MGRRSQSTALALGLAFALLLAVSPAFVPSVTGLSRTSRSQVTGDQALRSGGIAVMLASLPAPAHAGGMFDFGLTLPFVAVTFLTMMAVLNALWYSPVTNEMEERNAKLLQTLSEATDTLTKADEIQVADTEQIKEAREKASAAVAAYRETTEKAISGKIAAATMERDTKAKEVKAKLEADVQAKMTAAEAEIEKRKAAF